MSDLFRKFAERMSHAVGTPWAFLFAFLAVAIWAATGPLFGYSDTWQLVINTSTTIVTFLMVFLIQNTQNRDSRVVSLKLDELLRAMQGARTGLCNLDHMSDEELQKVQGEFERLQGKFQSSSTTTLSTCSASSSTVVRRQKRHSMMPVDAN